MTLAIIFENKILMLISLLIGSVIFVNGWTDAPNAITASVSTGALKMRTAVCIAALFNFIGAFVMGIANTSVLESVGNITMMIGQGNNSLLILGASLTSIIIWSVTAWYFGIPTSESHALISGILGAILACGGIFTNEGIHALKLSAIGLALSLPIGGGLGYVFRFFA
jgi:PiT family inorganic phosphate transporter